MKNYLLLICLFPIGLWSQTDTEILLFDMHYSNDSLKFSNKRNISNDPGYDNQPSFQSENLILFAGNTNGQTDIAQYNIRFDKKFWLQEDQLASQYSPQVLPGSNHVLAVHLDTTGVQRLYHHEFISQKQTVAMPDIRVAYFTPFNDSILIASVLSDDRLDLVNIDMRNKQVDTLVKGSGRSIHKVPDSRFVSYTVENAEGNQDLYLLDMDNTEQSYFVCQLPIGVQDYVWLDEQKILLGSKESLFIYDTLEKPEWELVTTLDISPFRNITRLAVSPKRNHIAIVVAPAQ